MGEFLNPHFNDFHSNFNCESCGYAPDYGNKPAYREWSKRVQAHHGYYPPGKTLRFTETVSPHISRRMVDYLGSQDEYGGDKPSYSADHGVQYPNVPCSHCPAYFYSESTRENHVEQTHPKEYDDEQFQKVLDAEHMQRVQEEREMNERRKH
ncbi:hypothetical protein UFOVP223_54 [uncultured Caudovirales phage]|uniref:C2H2-type domain-containing protein n=1 Tax=uncultured Caudovirales phage TaxID=2100421 RepID=A0A6J7WR38_9CAUD|nr:hypothetical protein UFOVP110_110 [uncultured Caudovirales phage]CAB5219298.1 hypothetical protein UFOVP223_54 [uncultured Caudovirales phage]